MKTKALLIGATATAALFLGGWALAQTHGPGHGPPASSNQSQHGTGPGTMHGMGPGAGHQMGPAMMQRMQQMMQQRHGGPGSGDQMGPGMMQHRGGHGVGSGGAHQGGGFADPARLDTVKGEIGITAAQEPAWTKYATAVEDAATAMRAVREGVDPTAVRNLSPADRFAFITKIREQAQKQHEIAQTAANDLLATLDDTQKTKAREVLPGLPTVGLGSARTTDAAGQQHQH